MINIFYKVFWIPVYKKDNFNTWLTGAHNGNNNNILGIVYNVLPNNKSLNIKNVQNKN